MGFTDLRALEQLGQSVPGVGGGGRGLSGVTEGGVALERRVEVGQAEKLGLDPMNDQEGSCPMCFQKGPPGVPRGA